MVFLHVTCLKWTKHGLKRTKKGTNGSKFAKKKSVSSGFGWYTPKEKVWQIVFERLPKLHDTFVCLQGTSGL